MRLEHSNMAQARALMSVNTLEACYDYLVMVTPLEALGRCVGLVKRVVPRRIRVVASLNGADG